MSSTQVLRPLDLTTRPTLFIPLPLRPDNLQVPSALTQTGIASLILGWGQKHICMFTYLPTYSTYLTLAQHLSFYAPHLTIQVPTNAHETPICKAELS